MKKTLGGDRLGSGNKMQVDMHEYGYSTHDLSYAWRNTQAPGTLVPFLSMPAEPGSSWDFDLQVDVKTHPTVGPLFGAYRVELHIFTAPIRLYQGVMHNDKLGTGLQMNTVKLPIMRIDAPFKNEIDVNLLPDLDNWQINPSCILAYFGLRGIGIRETSTHNKFRDFNGIPLLQYWDIYKNYYANKQEEVGYVIHTAPLDTTGVLTDIKVNGVSAPIPPATELMYDGTFIEIDFSSATFDDRTVGLSLQGNSTPVPVPELGTLVTTTPTSHVYKFDWATWGDQVCTGANLITNLTSQPIRLVEFNLSNVDDMREAILTNTTSSTAFNIFDQTLDPYDQLTRHDGAEEFYSIQATQEGLGIKCYQSDLLQNWLNTERIDTINTNTMVDTSGGSFSINALLMANKLFDVYNRIEVSGGSIHDWINAVWTQTRMTRATTPVFEGGLIKEIQFQEVISLVESPQINNEAQPLGTLAGRGVMGKKHHGGKITFRVEEPSYVMGICSITPIIDYSQGNQWDLGLKTLDDLHKPGLDGIGFQDLITEQMAWWAAYQDQTGTWTQRSAGKQPAWLNYMTEINKVRGNFAIQNNEMFMTLTRQYQPIVSSDSGTGRQVIVDIKDLTTYIDPTHYNHIFAQTSLDSMNFWVNVGVGLDIRRLISAKVMPRM